MSGEPMTLDRFGESIALRLAILVGMAVGVVIGAAIGWAGLWAVLGALLLSLLSTWRDWRALTRSSGAHISGLVLMAALRGDPRPRKETRHA